MRINCKCYIDFGTPQDNQIISSAYVRNREIYEKILDIAHEKLNEPLPRREYVIIEAPEDSEEFAEVLRLLSLAGYTPYYGESFPQDMALTRYPVRRFRKYDKKDYQKAEYFIVHRWEQSEKLFSYVVEKSGEPKASNTKARWKQRYGMAAYVHQPSGYYTPARGFFINDELKTEWEAIGMNGVAFNPVRIEDPSKAKGAFWELTSNVILPRCQLPIIKVPGYPKHIDWHRYDDKGHFPQELVFKRSEIEALGPFDFARSAVEEDLQSENRRWPRAFIVTAAARLVMMKQLKLSNVEYVPVRLV